MASTCSRTPRFVAVRNANKTLILYLLIDKQTAAVYTPISIGEVQDQRKAGEKSVGGPCRKAERLILPGNARKYL
jgi:hypothetical protein